MPKSLMFLTARCPLVGRSFVAGLMILFATAAGSQTFNDPGFGSEIVTTLEPFTPVGLAWAPDGRLFIWQKDGLVRIVKN